MAGETIFRHLAVLETLVELHIRLEAILEVVVKMAQVEFL